MELLELVDSDDEADTQEVDDIFPPNNPKDRVKGSIYIQEFDEQCARLMRVDRFASGHIWIASTFTLSEYTLQRETGVPPSIVQFSVSNADGQKDMRFTHLINGHAKMFTSAELYQIHVTNQQNKKPKGAINTESEEDAIDVFLRPGMDARGFDVIAAPEGHKTTDFFARNKATGSTAAVQASFVRFEEPKGQKNTHKSVNALKKYAESGVVTIVGVILKGMLHGAYIITPSLLPKLCKFPFPKRTFRPSPWSLIGCKTGSVSELLVSTWVAGLSAVIVNLSAYVAEKTAVTIPNQAPLALDFSPSMTGDHKTRDILRTRYSTHYVDGPVGQRN